MTHSTQLSSATLAFVSNIIPPVHSSRFRTSFTSSRTIHRKLVPPVRQKRSHCLTWKSPLCALGSEEDGYIVDADESLYELDDDDIDLENIEFPEGIPVLNTVYLTGRLGADPILKNVREGLDVCKFSIAVKHDYDPADVHDSDTSWFDVDVWGSLGRSVAPRLKKGLRVGVTGSLDVNSWTNRDGQLVQTPYVNASTVEILQSRSESMPSSISRSRPRDEDEEAASFVQNSKYSSTHLEGDLSDLPF